MGIEATLLAAGLSAGAASIGSSVIGIGLAAGLAYASSAITGKQRTAEQKGVQTSLRAAGDVPRGSFFGRQGTAGQLTYWNVSGPDNNYLDLIFTIGDGVHDGLEFIWVNGNPQALELVSSNTWYDHYAVDGFRYPNGVPLMEVTFFRGFEDQPVHGMFFNSANPPGRWTAADTGAGVCYIAVRCWYFKQWFPNDIPPFFFGIRGRRLYDWRRDSTVGGIGGHRWSDPKTWEFSENPFVQIYNFQRGLSLGGAVVLGMGVPPSDLVLDSYTAAANVSDESVVDAAGASAHRYSCGTYVSDDEEHGQVIERILESAAGAIYERSGLFSAAAGAPQTTVLTITDDDLIVGKPRRWSAKRTRSELINGVFGSCAAPDQMWGQVSYAPKIDDAAELIDGERRRARNDFPQVNQNVQAQRLALVHLRLARLQATTTISIGLIGDMLEPGDWIRWNSKRYGDRRYLVQNIPASSDRSVTLDLREISAAAFGFTDADEGGSADPGVANLPGVLLTTLPGMSLLARALTTASRLQTPAIMVFWSPITDSKVKSVRIEYRVKGAADALAFTFDDPSQGQVLISAGVQSETTYEVRGTIECDPPRAMTWTAWQEVVTTLQVVPIPPPEPISVEDFTEGLREMVEEALGEANADVQESLAQLNVLLAELAASTNEADLSGQSETRNVATLVRKVQAQMGEVRASVTEQITALASQTSAIAALVTTLEAQVNDYIASITVRYVAGVTPDGAYAAYQLQLIAGSVNTGLYAVARDNGAGGKVGEVWVEAGKFFIGSGSTFKAVFLVDTVAGKVYINGDLIANGTITAAHLNIATLSAIAANIGEVIAGVLRSADNRLRIDLTNARIVGRS